jgi:hypothetical protein
VFWAPKLPGALPAPGAAAAAWPPEVSDVPDELLLLLPLPLHPAINPATRKIIPAAHAIRLRVPHISSSPSLRRVFGAVWMRTFLSWFRCIRTVS